MFITLLTKYAYGPILSQLNPVLISVATPVQAGFSRNVCSSQRLWLKIVRMRATCPVNLTTLDLFMQIRNIYCRKEVMKLFIVQCAPSPLLVLSTLHRARLCIPNRLGSVAVTPYVF